MAAVAVYGENQVKARMSLKDINEKIRATIERELSSHMDKVVADIRGEINSHSGKLAASVKQKTEAHFVSRSGKPYIKAFSIVGIDQSGPEDGPKKYALSVEYGRHSKTGKFIKGKAFFRRGVEKSGGLGKLVKVFERAAKRGAS